MRRRRVSNRAGPGRPGLRGVGVESHPTSARLAKRRVEREGLTDRITIHPGRTTDAVAIDLPTNGTLCFLAAFVLHEMPVGWILSGVPQEIPPETRNMGRTVPCEAGQHWKWEGVLFTVLHPEAGQTGSDNERSWGLPVPEVRDRYANRGAETLGAAEAGAIRLWIGDGVGSPVR